MVNWTWTYLPGPVNHCWARTWNCWLCCKHKVTKCLVQEIDRIHDCVWLFAKCCVGDNLFGCQGQRESRWCQLSALSTFIVFLSVVEYVKHIFPEATGFGNKDMKRCSLSECIQLLLFHSDMVDLLQNVLQYEKDWGRGHALREGIFL